MEFRILGPLEVVDGGRPVELGGHKQRALLAVLLLQANEVVPQDRLVDDLWGETPPATAAKTLQAHVSRLRRALESGGAALETRGRGYVLRVDPGDIDAEVFRAALEEARGDLARGDAQAAATKLQEALGLWRGKPLTDFTYEGFAQTEIARLEELRLAALEERIEAELALGRHEALIPEVEALVAEHPLRERLLRQLMLALYRSGRQAEALHAYDRGRQTLANELGLTPSGALQQLQRQILAQDEALAAPQRQRAPLVPAVARRHPRRVAAAGAVLLAAAIAAAAFQLTADADKVAAAGALLLDPASGNVVDDVPLGSAPSSVAIGEGRVWVVDRDDRTISEIDPRARRVARTFAMAATPTDVAAGAGAVWVTNAVESESVLPASVSRVDPKTGVEVARIELPRSPGGHQFALFAGFSRQHVAATPDAVWVINQDGSVSRIDPRTNRRVATIGDVKAENIAAREGDVWITEGDARLTEIDPRLNRVSKRLDLPAEFLAALDVGGGSVWVADPFGGKVWRIDAGSKPTRRAIPVTTWTASVAFGEGVVWAANEIGDEIHRIDPRTNEARVAGRTIAPRDIEADDSTVWVTAASPPSPDAALPRSVCSGVFYGGKGKPELLLVSDLPLKGSIRTSTFPMVEAIRFVLERRGFEAGGRGVGYQSCDSSTAQADIDLFRCALNAKAYARNLKVVGVFGAFHSPCSFAQIPITNEAPEGPLAMISPSNTHGPLTTDKTLYPTGRRNYVRLAGADHLLAVAHAVLAKRLGADRLFILGTEQDLYGQFAATVRTAAKRLGVPIAGSATYDMEASEFADLARRVAAARPDTVVLEGIIVPETGRLIRDLRAELGPDVALIGPDGFESVDDLVKLAGPAAANGMYVLSYGIPNSHLPPQGRQFLSSFAATRSAGPGPDRAAAYGAQAAEILLDAISRSDGTRASVTRELRRTRVEDGILGDIRFDRNGDPVEAPFIVFRVAGSRFVVDRVVTARAELLKR